MNRLHKTLEMAAEEIENLYGKETELSNALREFIETADDLWEFAQSMPEYERLKERDRAMIVKEIYQDEYYCPACGTEIFYIGEKETHKFCLECGQRLDWSGEEEE